MSRNRPILVKIRAICITRTTTKTPTNRSIFCRFRSFSKASRCRTADRSVFKPFKPGSALPPRRPIEGCAQAVRGIPRRDYRPGHRQKLASAGADYLAARASRNRFFLTEERERIYDVFREISGVFGSKNCTTMAISSATATCRTACRATIS